MSLFFQTVSTLVYREWLRFIRSPGRIIGAIGAPFLFWALMGLGMGSSYSSYFYPGMLALVVLFTAIFSSISLIEDRNEGFLQLVLVTRAPRSALVLGKVLGVALLATFQSSILLVFAPLLGFDLNLSTIMATVGELFLLSISLGALGFLCAWKFNSVQSFHSVMNLLLFPMWLLSGALFSAEGAHPWMAAVMKANPLYYGLKALRELLASQGFAAGAIMIVALFTVIFFVLSINLVRRSQSTVAV